MSASVAEDNVIREFDTLASAPITPATSKRIARERLSTLSTRPNAVDTFSAHIQDIRLWSRNGSFQARQS